MPHVDQEPGVNLHQKEMLVKFHVNVECAGVVRAQGRGLGLHSELKDLPTLS